MSHKDSALLTDVRVDLAHGQSELSLYLHTIYICRYGRYTRIIIFAGAQAAQVLSFMCLCDYCVLVFLCYWEGIN